ncbi:MAG: Gfo/Idh/MocA family protein, partial [Candidatus Hinthialibacter sp.]
HNVYEGRKLVEAARKYKRIVQHGTQSRSSEALQEAVQLLRDGYLGEIYYAKGLCYKWRDTIGHTPDGQPPEGVNYNLWQGPAPEKPFSENRFHYNWHWNWLYGNGDIGNQGVHEMDMARWGLGVGMPNVIQAQGGHFMFQDDQETPNVLLATFKYPDVKKMLVFEVRHWHTNNELGEINGGDRNVVGNIFLGSEGYMTTYGFNQRGYQTYLGSKREKGKSRRSEEGILHFENFIQAVRSRRMDDLTAEIEEGHISASHCHLANAAYRVQETLRFDPKSGHVTNHELADAIIRDADRDYRKPFTIPDTI